MGVSVIAEPAVAPARREVKPYHFTTETVEGGGWTETLYRFSSPLTFVKLDKWLYSPLADANKPSVPWHEMFQEEPGAPGQISALYWSERFRTKQDPGQKEPRKLVIYEQVTAFRMNGHPLSLDQEDVTTAYLERLGTPFRVARVRYHKPPSQYGTIRYGLDANAPYADRTELTEDVVRRPSTSPAPEIGQLVGELIEARPIHLAA